MKRRYSNPAEHCVQQDDDPAAELRLSAEFEREMLALGDDTAVEEVEDDIKAATDRGYDRYAKGGA